MLSGFFRRRLGFRQIAQFTHGQPLVNEQRNSDEYRRREGDQPENDGKRGCGLLLDSKNGGQSNEAGELSAAPDSWQLQYRPHQRNGQ